MRSGLGAAVLIGALALFMCPTTVAQTNSIFRSVEAQPGRPLRLGVYAVVKRDCSTGPLPEIKVTTAPKKGALAVRSAKLRTNRLIRCPQLETPVQVVLYQANPGSTGPDEVSYNVNNQDGRIQSHTFKITITARPSTTPHSEPTTELQVARSGDSRRLAPASTSGAPRQLRWSARHN
jgi:hypothetical protein